MDLHRFLEREGGDNGFLRRIALRRAADANAVDACGILTVGPEIEIDASDFIAVLFSVGGE